MSAILTNVNRERSVIEHVCLDMGIRNLTRFHSFFYDALYHQSLYPDSPIRIQPLIQRKLTLHSRLSPNTTSISIFNNVMCLIKFLPMMTVLVVKWWLPRLRKMVRMVRMVKMGMIFHTIRSDELGDFQVYRISKVLI